MKNPPERDDHKKTNFHIKTNNTHTQKKLKRKTFIPALWFHHLPQEAFRQRRIKKKKKSKKR